MASGSSWGSDSPISMPAPLRQNQVPQVAMEGFCFTNWGIAHNMTSSDEEAFLVPTFMPPHPAFAQS